jgi:hypothetical protein
MYFSNLEFTNMQTYGSFSELAAANRSTPQCFTSNAVSNEVIQQLASTLELVVKNFDHADDMLLESGELDRNSCIAAMRPLLSEMRNHAAGMATYAYREMRNGD